MENLTESQVKRAAEPVAYKTTIALMNLVIARTTDFMNKFYSETESKLIKIEQKVERVETLLDLLEKKMDSIPNSVTGTPSYTPNQGYQVQQQATQQVVPQQQVQQQVQQQPVQMQQTMQTPVQQQPSGGNVQVQQINQQQAPVQQQQQPQEEAKPEVDLEREKYASFIKLFKIGVPLQALHPKMIAEGLDPKGIEKYVDVSSRP